MQEIVNLKIEEVVPYDNNPRLNEKGIEVVQKSIEEFGFRNPIVVDRDKTIIVGHTRFEASKRLGYEEVPCIIAYDLTEEQVKAFRIMDNKSSEYSEWDMDKLKAEIEDLDYSEFELDLTGFESSEIDDIFNGNFDSNSNAEYENEIEDTSIGLNNKFIIPPFSVIDSGKGYWQDRKRGWRKLGLQSEIGRDVKCNPTISQFKFLKSRSESVLNESVSIFDPVLCEIIYKWFNVENGVIYDSFGGGSVRGIVACYLGYEYLGIELRDEQVNANIENAKALKLEPKWICDDSLNVDKYLDDNSVDLFFSCPPYLDLEVYSNDERDLSNMEYDKFIDVYREIIKKGCNKLKENRFAVFVVGDVRDKKGAYRDFIGTTKKAFMDCGLSLYNDIVFKESAGTAALRCSNSFKNRKVVKIHQNVLVFYKGDFKEIPKNYNKVEVNLDLLEEE